jgi:hypothetical protein
MVGERHHPLSERRRSINIIGDRRLIHWSVRAFLD